MPLFAPSQAPALNLRDTQGKPVTLGQGKRTLLAFFRDTACPFCNLRIFQMTQHHAELAAQGLEMIAVFASSEEEVARFVAARQRPFSVVADANNQAYQSYEVEHSFWRKLWAVLTRPVDWLTGMGTLGFAGTVRGLGGLNTGNILPADFLIDEFGRIQEVYYGKDAGDHIPFERIEQFAKAPKK